MNAQKARSPSASSKLAVAAASRRPRPPGLTLENLPLQTHAERTAGAAGNLGHVALDGG